MIAGHPGIDTAAMAPAERLLERLAHPETVDAINRLLDHLDLIAFSVDALDGFLRRSDTVVDSVAESVDDLRHIAPSVTTGETIEKLKILFRELPALVDVGIKIIDSGLLTRLEQLVDAGVQLVDSGLFEPSIVSVLAEAGRTVAVSYDEVRAKPPKPAGVIGLVRTLNDPQIQLTLMFFLEIARRYSRTIK